MNNTGNTLHFKKQKLAEKQAMESRKKDKPQGYSSAWSYCKSQSLERYQLGLSGSCTSKSLCFLSQYPNR